MYSLIIQILQINLTLYLKILGITHIKLELIPDNSLKKFKTNYRFLINKLQEKKVQNMSEFEKEKVIRKHLKLIYTYLRNS